LYSELDQLERVLDSRNEEIDQLKSSLDQSKNHNNRLMDDKSDLERTISELNDLKSRNKIQIERLNDSNDRNSKLILDHESTIKNLAHEKNNLQKRFDDLSFENSSNISKLKSKEEALHHTKIQLEDTSRNLNKLNVINI
jgi:chromosome segregation ATPase